METRYTLADAPAGHPFRRDLTIVSHRMHISRMDNDWKLFVLSFTAFFICFYTFIA